MDPVIFFLVKNQNIIIQHFNDIVRSQAWLLWQTSIQIPTREEDDDTCQDIIHSGFGSNYSTVREYYQNITNIITIILQTLQTLL